METLVIKKSSTEFDPDFGRSASSSSGKKIRPFLFPDAFRVAQPGVMTQAPVPASSYHYWLGTMPDAEVASLSLWASKLLSAYKSFVDIKPERPELKRQIQDVGQRAGEENWDDDNAAAVSSLAVQQALRLADLLPADVDDPEVAPTPHGEIDFDWMNTDREMLTVSVDANGAVAWAAEINGLSCRGTFATVNELPCPLECCLRPFYRR